MEFIGGMKAVLLAEFPQAIIILRVCCFFIHHHLYRAFNIITILPSLILYKSLNWHNHKADYEYIKFSERLKKVKYTRSKFKKQSRVNYGQII